MTVRAKFQVSKVAKIKVGTGAGGLPVFGYEVLMYPVSNGSAEDKSFWQATPSGELKMSILNVAAGEQFEPGDSFYVDLTRAE